jgi:hypothetical protein
MCTRLLDLGKKMRFMNVKLYLTKKEIEIATSNG